MKKNFLISIIVPVYNVETFLEECVNSVLKQTYKNYEILLIDDGSTDNSSNMCDKFKKKDKRIKVFHIDNVPIGKVRNFGIKKSKGDYILFLDSDDYYLNENFLSVIVEKIHLNNELVIFGFKKYDNKLIDCDKLIYSLKNKYNHGDELLFDVLTQKSGFYWYVWQYLFKKDLFIKNNIFFPESYVFEDFAILYKLILKSKNIFVYKNDSYCHRIRKNSITSGLKLQNHLEHLNFISENIAYINKNNITDELKKMLLNNFAQGYIGALIEVGLLSDDDQKALLKELEDKKIFLEYINSGKQLFIKYMVKVFDLGFTSKILSFRRYIKYGK